VVTTHRVNKSNCAQRLIFSATHRQLGCMRARGLIAALAALGLIAGCAGRSGRPDHHVLTGTCEGACEHYMACKETSDQGVFQACAAECPQVFSSPDSLRAFESLRCDDAVVYVEGESGRGPGAVPAADAPAEPSKEDNQANRANSEGAVHEPP
jgi:hypothetical protein